MLHILIMLSVGFIAFTIPNSYALQTTEPCPPKLEVGCESSGGGFDQGSRPDVLFREPESPTGMDDAKLDPKIDALDKKNEANEANKPKRPSVGTFGRRTSSTLDTKPPMSICERAQDARGRNSPTAPGLEARCQATKH